MAIKILKKTPLTFHGVDCIEYLLKDDTLINCECCDLCIYNSWTPDDLLATCADVHVCGFGPTYFQILPMLDYERTNNN